MKILITGCAGFIASHLIDFLTMENTLRNFPIEKIVGVDNFVTGRYDNMDGFVNSSVFKYFRADIADSDTMDVIISGYSPDVIVHAAASYKDPDDWETDARTNVVGAAVLCELAKEYGVKRIVYFQTALCYGLKPLEQPITLSHPIRPEGSTYAITKTAAEKIIQMSGIEYVSLRLANAYGDRNLSGPVPTFYQKLTQNKPCFVMDTRRDFIYVGDLVDVAFSAVMGRGSGAYHIASGRDYSIKELYDGVRKAIGMESAEVEVRKRNPDDVATILLDPARTEQDFGWKVHTPLSVGLQAAVDWYKSHEFGETFTHLKSVKE
jgi:UDP-glucose 4-epimerase